MSAASLVKILIIYGNNRAHHVTFLILQPFGLMVLSITLLLIPTEIFIPILLFKQGEKIGIIAIMVKENDRDLIYTYPEDCIKQLVQPEI